ncbi:MAG: hypothetical protein J6T11_04845, partial [Bacteroidaceae bacterium]|nr:hypothetical protein [Bacteroidaceae bacterium]
NKVNMGMGSAFFYENEGVAIGDLYPYEDCHDIVIFKTNELFYGLFPEGTMMKSMRGIKIDSNNVKTEGCFNLDVISDMQTPFVR